MKLKTKFIIIERKSYQIVQEFDDSYTYTICGSTMTIYKKFEDDGKIKDPYVFDSKRYTLYKKVK